jgi:subtilisin family serine protease
MVRALSSRASCAHVLLASASIFAVAGCAVDSSSSVEETPPSMSATATTAQLLRSEKAVPGQYIVVLRDGELDARGERALEVSAELAQSVGAEVLFTYQHSIKGFAGKMSEEGAKRLLADPRVDFITEDGVVQLENVDSIGTNITQPNAPWGLDRVDQRNLPLTTSYSYISTGAGVHAYIIDTGIRATHTQYAGRVANFFDYSGGNANDCNGHGTHLAGIIGGTTYGAAKQVTLHAVRVLDCAGSGTFAQIAAGVDWVTANRVLPAVANIALGGAPNAALEAAINRSISVGGVVYVASAGSQNGDACNFSPARIPAVYTIASTTSADAAHAASNKGPCIDLFAPGITIPSSWHTSDVAVQVLAGTAMAAAHATGVAARYLQNGSAASLIGQGTVNVLTGVPANTVNRLLFIQP